jgi:hypothetical protein
MITVAARFERSMDQIGEWVALTQAAISLAGSLNGRFRSGHPAATAARTLSDLIKRLGTQYGVLSYEGAYLSACAGYETAVRDIIESFVFELTRIKPNYADLPDKVIKSHHAGCAKILTRLNSDRYSHLEYENVVTDMSSCLPASKTKFILRPEAFSEHDWNLKSEILTSVFERIALKNVWQPLSREAEMQSWAGSSQPKIVLHRSTNCLNDFMAKRNRLMHVGPTAFPAGPADVTECAKFFKVLIRSLESVANNHLSTM